MILSDRTIRGLAANCGLIEPFDEDQLQPCSYDVRLDGRIKLFGITKIKKHPKGHIIGRVIDASSKELSGISMVDVDISNKSYVLNPGEFILGSTVESVSIPDYLACRFEGKSSLGRIGLTTHVTAGFIDPGFQGTITLEIKNENQFPILLKPGMLIGQLCFIRLNTKVDRTYGSVELGSHYQNQIGVTEARP